MKLLAVLSAAYPRMTLPQATEALYVEELGRLDPDRAMTAIRTCIRDLKYWPTIAEILERYEPARPLVLPDVPDDDDLMTYEEYLQLKEAEE